MKMRSSRKKNKRFLKRYEFQFVLSPGKVTYSRSANIDPGARLIYIIQVMLPKLKQQHPDLFSKFSVASLFDWRFYFGYDVDKNEAEELDPGLSFIESGIFPGSVITLGPKRNFK